MLRILDYIINKCSNMMISIILNKFDIIKIIIILNLELAVLFYKYFDFFVHNK
jgi:hypothetical protein